MKLFQHGDFFLINFYIQLSFITERQGGIRKVRRPAGGDRADSLRAERR